MRGRCPTHKRPSPLPALQRPAFSPFPWLSPQPLAHPGLPMSASHPLLLQGVLEMPLPQESSLELQTRVALFCFSGSRHSSQGHLRKCVSHSVLLSRGPAPPESRPGDSRNQATWVNTNRPKHVAIGAYRLSWGACLSRTGPMSGPLKSPSGRSPRQGPLDPKGDRPAFSAGSTPTPSKLTRLL